MMCPEQDVAARDGQLPVKGVLIVDDVAEMRALLRTVVGRRPGLGVAGEASDARQAVRLAADLQPDVVVLDLGLPDLEGQEVLSGIRTQAPSSRIVVFSGKRVTNHAWLAGRVEGFVSRDEDLEILIDLMEAVAREELNTLVSPLPWEIGSVAQARTLTRQALTEWGVDGLVAEALVVVSELVTNALTHARSHCELRLSSHRTSLRIAVVDHGMGTPDPLAASAVRVGGRGLQIVDSLSSAWGVDSLNEGGKLVWAELARKPGRQRAASGQDGGQSPP